MRTLLVLAAAALVVGGAPAGAQTPPAGAPMRPTATAPDAAIPLTMAYRAIGHAETAGASGHFIDAARTHYRSALDRYNRNDATGAVAEARLASDLARAAIDERGRAALPAPRDVPAPPTPGARGGTVPGMHDGMMPGGMHDGVTPGGMHGMMPGGMHGIMPGGMRGFGPRGFSATHLAEALKADGAPETRALAQAAVDANAAAERAALAGNVEEAARASRVAGDLMAAVDDLVRLNHPPAAPRVMRRPLGG